ncbi:formate--tetrahydrofolate ligase, partial [Staphylococcus epidermidis]|uniref:formate--tetrahydrofolate ligase n=1 Tax=Staphylococcus epidermidis TaxID=1282 RepID=UPI0011A7465A
PPLLHPPPFPNIPHPSNSILPTQTPTNLSHILVTQPPFPSHLPPHNFINIKPPQPPFHPSPLLLLPTIPPFKIHAPLPKHQLQHHNIHPLQPPLLNLQTHLNNIKKYPLQPILPLNPFIHHTPSQTPSLKQSPKHNQLPIPLTEVWQKPPQAAIQLPNQLFHLIHQPQNFNHLYHLKQ